MRPNRLWHHTQMGDDPAAPPKARAPAPEPAEITGLLDRWVAGQPEALDRLLPLVLEELRRLARHHMRQVGDTVVMQPTALVNEAYLKLLGAEVHGFDNRSRFFAFASRVMRDLVRDHARRKATGKRGGAAQSLPIDDALNVGGAVDLETAAAINEALERLIASHPRQARVVELRLWSGLTIAEVAEVLGRSRQTVERDWALGRRRLARDLHRAH